MTVRRAMQFTEVDRGEAERLIADPDWVMEQKLDGTRVLISVTPERVTAFQSGGQVLGHTAATQHLPGIVPVLTGLMAGHDDGELVFDGELMTGTGEYHVFDLPWAELDGVRLVSPLEPLYIRRSALSGLFAAAAGQLMLSKVRLVKQARTTTAKRELWQQVQACGAEGVMVKHADGRYQPGQRVNTVVKLKLTKTADVVVTARDVGGKNARLGVWDGDHVVEVGGCSMIGKPDAQVGQVIEVAYLYWTGSALYQPRMMRIREDKAPAACGLDQFPRYSREVI